MLSVAEEATVLIGAHTIGLIRNTFGASLAGPVRFHMCILRFVFKILLISSKTSYVSGSLTGKTMQHLSVASLIMPTTPSW